MKKLYLAVCFRDAGFVLVAILLSINCVSCSSEEAIEPDMPGDNKLAFVEYDKRVVSFDSAGDRHITLEELKFPDIITTDALVPEPVFYDLDDGQKVYYYDVFSRPQRTDRDLILVEDYPKGWDAELKVWKYQWLTIKEGNRYILLSAESNETGTSRSIFFIFKPFHAGYGFYKYNNYMEIKQNAALQTE